MKIKDYFIVLVLVILDQASKLYFATNFALGQSVKVIDGFFYLTYVRNTGAAFSLMEGMKWGFVVSAICIFICLVYYLNKNKVSIFEKIAILMIMAGAVGNVIDRLRLSYVIDFLDFYIFGYDFPIFNVADICVTCGVILLAITYLFSKEK